MIAIAEETETEALAIRILDSDPIQANRYFDVLRKGDLDKDRFAES